jgi:uncharacterized membrane protein YfcA
MDLVFICFAAFLAGGLTLFSGFGLGTLLLPVFAVFFSIEVSVAATAIVHLLNNLLKLVLLGRYADRSVVLQFGVPAILAAFVGAWMLDRLSGLAPLMHYRLCGETFEVMPVKVTVAALLLLFTFLELILKEGTLAFDRKYLPLGGAMSGFFGGLSGHQGALRSAFLIKCGLSKHTFLGSGVVIACLVDVSRIAVYAAAFPSISVGPPFLLPATIVASFGGTWLGNHLAQKVTVRIIQVIVSIMVLGIAIGLCLGII